jgi:NAD+ diphosphatase
LAGDLIMPTLRAVKSLDRVSHKRADTDWLAGQARSPRSRTLLLVDLKVAIVSNVEQTQSSLRWFSATEIEALGLTGWPKNFLGLDASGAPCFAAAISEHRAVAAPGGPFALRPCVDLRSLMVQGQLDPEELSIAGSARALAEWHSNARHCGHCGSATDIKDGGWRRKCVACGKEIFPRTDPVVIMLVTHGDKCLISHEPRFKSIQEKMFSTLAGFLEPGEDIEHAVRREVKEEVGLDVGKVSYQESQPWPFPHSLMIGCRAEALGSDLKLDLNEIAEARWIDRAELRLLLAGHHPEGHTLPGKHAIARKLLEAFLGV